MDDGAASLDSKVFFCSTMNYTLQLKDPRWQKKRLEVLQRDKFTCQLCSDTTTELHVHHNSYGNYAWDTELEDLITYCKCCHSIVSEKRGVLPVIKVFKFLISKDIYLVTAVKKYFKVTDLYFFDKKIGELQWITLLGVDYIEETFHNLMSLKTLNNG